MSHKQMRFHFSSHVETDQAQQLDHANCQAENLESAIFFIKTGSYSQNIIINTNTNKY